MGSVVEIAEKLNDEFSTLKSVHDETDELKEKLESYVFNALKEVRHLYILNEELGAGCSNRGTFKDDGEAMHVAYTCHSAKLSCKVKKGVFSRMFQTCVHVVLLMLFARGDDLPSAKEVCKLWGWEGHDQDAFFYIDAENYLLGVCAGVADVVNLMTKRVIGGDYKTAVRCYKFASEIFEAFKVINLRNDLLRRKFDGMKYDIKRLEEMVYDISIRGLLKESHKRDAAPSLVNNKKQRTE